jgi:hypothetical protein
MKQIGNAFASKIARPCVDVPLADTRPDPGLQPDCRVTDQIPNASGGYDDVPLPPCSSGAATCWDLAPDATCRQSGFKIVVRRDHPAAPGAQQAIKCLGCTRPDDQRCLH